MSGPKNQDDRSSGNRRPPVEEEGYEPDFAEEHTPSATDPPNAWPDDNAPDERWDKPTEV
jgi:hypothetical protein